MADSRMSIKTGQLFRREADGRIIEYMGLSDNFSYGKSLQNVGAVFKNIWPTSVLPYSNVNFQEFLRDCADAKYILVQRNPNIEGELFLPCSPE